MGVRVSLAIEFLHSSSATLFFNRKADKLLTFYRATSLILLPTTGALNEEQVTKVVGTISMGIARSAALVAMSNDVRTNALAKALVKDEIFTYKFIR